jgi:hypothetical protein
MTVDSDLDLFLVGDHAVSGEPSWADQVHRLAATVTRWTGNDARVIEYTTTELRAARKEPVVQDVLENGVTVAGSRAWLIKQLRTASSRQA